MSKALIVVAAVIVLGLAALLAGAGVRWSREPAEVADHAAPFVATFELRFAYPTLVGQSFEARQNNLSRLDVILAADPERPPPRRSADLAPAPRYSRRGRARQR